MLDFIFFVCKLGQVYCTVLEYPCSRTFEKSNSSLTANGPIGRYSHWMVGRPLCIGEKPPNPNPNVCIPRLFGCAARQRLPARQQPPGVRFQLPVATGQDGLPSRQLPGRLPSKQALRLCTPLLTFRVSL